MAKVTVQLQVPLPNVPRGTRLEVDDETPLVRNLIANRRMLVIEPPAAPEPEPEPKAAKAAPAKAASKAAEAAPETPAG